MTMEEERNDENKASTPGNGLKLRESAEAGGESPGDETGEEATPLKEQQGRYPMNYDEENIDDLESSTYSDKLNAIAHKCKLTPKKSLIYLLVCCVIIFLLFFILITLIALWPPSPAANLCESSKCHSLSAKVRPRPLHLS
jgi:hypothetical protein